MTVAEPKYRRPLNPEQLAVLDWLYKVRFSSSKQIAKYLLKPNQKTIQNKLQILEERGFISKHYDKSYKLAGRPAEYFLTPQGARQLPADSTNEWAIKALYKNKTVSLGFITHCLNVADTVLTLQALYGDKLRLFTRSHLVSYDYFPSWTPDLFLSFKGNGNKPRRYFLDVWDVTQPFFVSVRKARNYINYATDGDWPYEHGDLPTVLALCSNEQTQKKLNRQIYRAIEEEDMWDEITFATVTREQLEKATATSKLWQRIDEERELAHMSL
jgi:DNA-binding HxlR family transcriptional regulator